jgi:hypothetical protein
MQCPKCGTENPDDAQVCTSCNSTLTGLPKEQPPLKSKTSLLAIGSALLSGLSVALLFLVNPTLAFFVSLLAFFSAFSSIRSIRKSDRKLIGKKFAIGAFIFSSVQMVLLSYWRIDAPPIPNDYTIADLRSAPLECARSYELLMSLSEEQECSPDAPKIGLSEQDVNTIEQVNEVIKEGDYSKITEVLEANADNIKQAWKNGQKGRDIISELNTFPEIADLTEPYLDTNIGFLRNLRHLARLYQAYVYLQTEQGNEKIAVEELSKLDNFFRKLNSNARSMITKLVCIACFRVNIKTANFIINNPQISQESLGLLAEHFVPLANEQISLRNSFISEYLMFKNELSKILRDSSLKYSAFSPLKLNSSFRVYKNFCDRWIASEENRQEIERLTVWPALYPQLPVTIDPNGNLPWYYKAYNPVGSILIGILTPALNRVSKIKTNTQIQDDLLQIVLNKRLGNEVSLKARAYSDEYIIDTEKKIIFSPGPDGKADTKDDIKLIINPEVLNLTD